VSETSPQTLLRESPPFRRTVVMMVLIAILLFDWQPDARLLPPPARRREHDEPIPLPDLNADLSPRGARTGRQEAKRPLPGARQAARRRSFPRG
jgi:hypothetical protein